ncbi:MAG: hypothetical protein V4628_07520 [Pseudomonadota bacterium]
MNQRFIVSILLAGISVGLASAFFLTASERPDEGSIISEATAGLLTATAGKVFEASCNMELDYDAQVIDLNADGQPEVFTQLYGTCIGGGAGVSLDLYIKDDDGRWNSQFGFPGVYSVLESKNLGYPDISIGGPGNCFPIWRWDGKMYQLFQNCAP